MDRGDAGAMITRTPVALTIAGSDSGGGAGVQADLRTFAALGVFGACAITAVTAQNTLGVRAIHPVPPDVVRAQIEAVVEDFSVAAIKIGMLVNAGIVAAVADALSRRREPSSGAARRLLPEGEGRPIDKVGGPSHPAPLLGEARGFFVVYDPVLAASSGDALAGAGFAPAVVERLLPLVDCLTPNVPEAAALLGEAQAANEADMARQGRALLRLGPAAVLMKGGHLAGDEAVDLLVTMQEVRRFAAARIVSPNTHGTGCTLSSAIAAKVALGLPLADAVTAAKAFVGAAIERGAAARLGHGSGPLLQFPLLGPLAAAAVRDRPG